MAVPPSRISPLPSLLSQALSSFCSHALISPRWPVSPSRWRFRNSRSHPCGATEPTGNPMNWLGFSGARLRSFDSGVQRSGASHGRVGASSCFLSQRRCRPEPDNGTATEPLFATRRMHKPCSGGPCPSMRTKRGFAHLMGTTLTERRYRHLSRESRKSAVGWGLKKPLIILTRASTRMDRP
jgi:hypothetical protein